jgi:5-methylcytosine-specific restriction endonuclease McrA
MYKTYNCVVCNTESRFKHSKSNQYCSIKCQQKFERNLKIKNWIENGVSWSITRRVPDWAISAIVERNGYKCSSCGISSYNNLPIRLECDHIDGNPSNNNISNMRLLCPNCHSQTDTYKNKNRGNGRAHRRKINLPE